MTLTVPLCGQWALFSNVSVAVSPGQTVTASITGNFSMANGATDEGFFGLCYQYTDSSNTTVTQPFGDPNYKYAGGSQGIEAANSNAVQIGQEIKYPTGATGTAFFAVNLSGSVTIPTANPAGNTIPSGNMLVGICSYHTQLGVSKTSCDSGAGAFGQESDPTTGTPYDAVGDAMGYVQVSNP